MGSAVMMESNLLGGAQDFSIQPFVYSRSITDARLSWEQTLPVLAKVAAAVRARRAVTS
jgi:3-deoxy-7-phosphoheptulonate synthase